MHIYNNISFPGLTGSKALSLEGNYFIINETEQTYYHFLMDQIGQYLYLKSLYPDLGLLIFKQEVGDSRNYAEWCMGKLKEEFPYTEISLSEYGHLSVEQITVLSNRLIDIYHLIDDNLNDFLLDKDYTAIVAAHLKKFFNRHIEASKISKKIFLSRSGKREELSEARNKISEPTSLEEQQIIARYLDPKMEDLIESLFRDAGYEIINFEDYSFQEQLELCASASSIGLFVGASAINTIVAPQNTEILLISHDTSYPFPVYHDLIDSINSNTVHILDPREYPDTRNTIEVIQRLTKSLYPNGRGS